MDYLPLVTHQADPNAGSPATTKSAFIGTIKNLLGENVAVSRDTGVRIGAPHATTGIPYAISGTATVINSNVSAKLATFTDPIKAILGTGVHSTQRIIIKRKYVAGGGAQVVPEHASARTVAIREDVREVMLTRYGNDIEMNLNLFLRPKDAEEELTMKLEASQIGLEKQLIRLGYEAIMDNGIDLAVGIATSRNQMSLSDMSNVYCRQLFGVFAKSAYPITTIMAAAKMANAYSVSQAEKTVMIIPFGTPELIKFTKPHYMEYNLSGIPASARDKIDLKIPGGRIDEFSNCTIYQHVPPVDMNNGVPFPVVEDSLLSRYVTVVSRVPLPERDSSNVTTEGIVTDCTDTGAPGHGTFIRGAGGTFAVKDDLYVLNYKTGDRVKLPILQPCPQVGAAMVGMPTAVYFKGHNLSVMCANWETVNTIDIAGRRNPGFANVNAAGKLALRDWANIIEDAYNHFYSNPGGRSISEQARRLITIGLQMTHFIRRSRFKMRSGILAAPGSSTGELLYAYSSCSVSTNPSTELGKLGLRVYLGAAIYRPENIFILPNIAFESVVSDVLVPCSNFPDGTVVHHTEEDTRNAVFAKDREYQDWYCNPGIVGCFLGHSENFGSPVETNLARHVLYNTPGDTEDQEFALHAGPIENVKEGELPKDRNITEAAADSLFRPHVTDDGHSFNINVANSSVFDKTGRQVINNTGPLGELDVPHRIGRLNGLVEFNESGPV